MSAREVRFLGQNLPVYGRRFLELMRSQVIKIAKIHLRRHAAMRHGHSLLEGLLGLRELLFNRVITAPGAVDRWFIRRGGLRLAQVFFRLLRLPLVQLDGDQAEEGEQANVPRSACESFLEPRFRSREIPAVEAADS